jgi:polysaccharide pyruvyl transferase
MSPAPRYAALCYRPGRNLGDEIQTLAVEQFLPRIDARLDRDSLSSATVAEPHIVVMNGWFAEDPEGSWPPADGIVPVFVGLHIADKARHQFTTARSIEYLKAHAPIGCRDDGTREFLEALGVPAETTLCLSLTFPTRGPELPENGVVVIVDGEKIPIPDAIRRDAIEVTHETQAFLSPEGKRQVARELLDLYRTRASLVITSRLHCALPCVAMGIPVMYFGDRRDPRLGPLKAVGVEIHRLPRRPPVWRRWRARWPFRPLWIWWAGRKISWSPAPVDVADVKARLEGEVRRRIDVAARGISQASPPSKIGADATTADQ